MDDTLNSTSRMLGPSESEALVEAGDAVDALFHWVNSDKLKLADLFNRIDKDNSGALEKDEFAMCMTMLGVPVEERHLEPRKEVCALRSHWLLVQGHSARKGLPPDLSTVRGVPAGSGHDHPPGTAPAVALFEVETPLPDWGSQRGSPLDPFRGR